MPRLAPSIGFILLSCVVLTLIAAGCTSGSPPAVTPLPTSPPATPIPTPSIPSTPITLPTVSLTGTEDTTQPGTACVSDSDCVPAECCHPTSCINRAEKHVCTLLCTDVCMGPIDCGAGHCGCDQGTCAVRSGPAP